MSKPVSALQGEILERGFWIALGVLLKRKSSIWRNVQRQEPIESYPFGNESDIKSIIFFISIFIRIDPVSKWYVMFAKPYDVCMKQKMLF